MGNVRRLALRTERLAELSSDEMRTVNGGASLVECIVVFDPTYIATVCGGCLTRDCQTLAC